MRKAVLVPLLALGVALGALAVPARAAETAAPEIQVRRDGAFLAGATLYLHVSVEGLGPGETAPGRILVDGQEVATVELTPGDQKLKFRKYRVHSGRHTVVVEAAGTRGEVTYRALPGWLSIVPPVVAIALALAFKDVIVALFCGVFLGALSLYGFSPLVAFARTGDTFIIHSLVDLDGGDLSHLQIVVFSTLLGGMVGIISKSGGTRGIVERLAPYATTGRRSQVATWVMGLVIFFDDYANTLIVGSTMRPITDRLRVSREKLAYIVDSTAAPVASVIPISTWIGFEVGLIAAAFKELGLHYNAYATFVDSIPYRFYPIFALVLGFAIAFSGKDFGPMLKAERRAAATGEVLAHGAVPLADYTKGGLEPRHEIPKRAINALVPIVGVVVVTITGLYTSGVAALAAGGLGRADFPGPVDWLREVFSAADPYNSLLWASMTGVLLAFVLPVVQRIIPAKEAMDGMLEGFKAMVLAIVVLILAWSIGSVCTDLHTADWLVGATEEVLSPHLLPALAFVLSAAVAFATGTSWGTMGILMPLVIPVAHQLSLGAGLAVESDPYYIVMLGTISSVLAGSIWGDHCSPISDTTILSSMASGCDHIAHVRTQLPYALSIGAVGIVVGDIPTAYGLSPWVSILVGSTVIVGGLLWLGKKSEPGDRASEGTGEGAGGTGAGSGGEGERSGGALGAAGRPGGAGAASGGAPGAAVGPVGAPSPSTGDSPVPAGGSSAPAGDSPMPTGGSSPVE